MIVFTGWPGAGALFGAMVVCVCAGWWLRTADYWRDVRRRTRAEQDAADDLWAGDLTGDTVLARARAIQDGIDDGPGWDPPADHAGPLLGDDTRPRGWAAPEPSSLGEVVNAVRDCRLCKARAGTPHTVMCRNRRVALDRRRDREAAREAADVLADG